MSRASKRSEKWKEERKKIPGTAEYAEAQKLKEQEKASTPLDSQLSAGFEQHRIYKEAMAKGDYAKAKEASMIGSWMFTLEQEDYERKQKAKAASVPKAEKKSGFLAPPPSPAGACSPRSPVIPTFGKMEAIPETGRVYQKREKKPYPEITSEYGEWTDDVGLIYFLHDYGKKYESVDNEYRLYSYDPDKVIILDPLQRSTEPWKQALINKAQKRQRMRAEYFAALRNLPEVKEVTTLLEKQGSSKDSRASDKYFVEVVIDGLDAFQHGWREKDGRGGSSFKVTNPKTGCTISFARFDSKKVSIFLYRKDGNSTEEKKEIQRELGPMVKHIKTFFYSFNKRELLATLKDFLVSGWRVDIDLLDDDED
jgi:hypothetical protein